MGKTKDPRLSTRWFLANEEDAEQIAFHFHGPGNPGAWNFIAHHAQIKNAVVGQPKKQVLALVEWALAKRLEAPEEEPFLCGVAFDEWAKRRRIGTYKYAEVEV